MKRRTVFSVSGAVLLALSLAVEPVRTFALNAMSVFRVQGQESVQITPDDLQFFVDGGRDWLSRMTVGSAPDGAIPDGPEDPHGGMPNGSARTALDAFENHLRGSVHRLDALSEFTAFPVSLPRGWDSADLYAADARETAGDVSLEPINETLSRLGLSVLPDEWEGAQVTLRQSPILLARQDRAALLICRPPEVLLSDGLDPDVLFDIMSELPVFSPSLARQIRNVRSGVFYLPDFSGFTQTAEIGGKMAFVYPLNELSAYLGGLTGGLAGETPDDAAGGAEPPSAPSPAAHIGLAGTLVAFVRDGSLYLLAGDASVSEMVQLARSI